MRIKKNSLLSEISDFRGFKPVLSLVSNEQPEAAKAADKLNLKKLTLSASQNGLEIISKSAKESQENQDKPEEVLSDKKSIKKQAVKDSFVDKLENQENSEAAATSFASSVKATPASMAKALKEIEANHKENKQVRPAPTNKAPEGGWRHSIEEQRSLAYKAEKTQESELKIIEDGKTLDRVQQEREQADIMLEIVKQVNIREILKERTKFQQKQILGQWTELAVTGRSPAMAMSRQQSQGMSL
jgi:hypothetical protein